MYETLLRDHHRALIRHIIQTYGLRPVVDAVADAALAILQRGNVVKNERGEPMDPEDVETAARVLMDGDLY